MVTAKQAFITEEKPTLSSLSTSGGNNIEVNKSLGWDAGSCSRVRTRRIDR